MRILQNPKLFSLVDHTGIEPAILSITPQKLAAEVGIEPTRSLEPICPPTREKRLYLIRLPNNKTDAAGRNRTLA